MLTTGGVKTKLAPDNSYDTSAVLVVSEIDVAEAGHFTSKVKEP